METMWTFTQTWTFILWVVVICLLLIGMDWDFDIIPREPVIDYREERRKEQERYAREEIKSLLKAICCCDNVDQHVYMGTNKDYGTPRGDNEGWMRFARCKHCHREFVRSYLRKYNKAKGICMISDQLHCGVPPNAKVEEWYLREWYKVEMVKA